MRKKSIPNSAFAHYIQSRRDIIARLESFRLPMVQSWEIDWQFLKEIAMKKSEASWDSLPIYKDLRANKNTPGIYFLSIEKSDSLKLFTTFQKQKEFSALIGNENGVRADGFLNISHVPKNFRESDCLYVGSRKKNLHERFRQHLGFGASRTGALHLGKVLAKTRLKPTITFNYYLLERQDEDLTVEIESIIQKHLKPIIGKGILGD